MAELVVRGLSKSYGPVTALSRVDLTVGSGALMAVLGPSGCGKTTLLRCIAGFETPDAGEIIVAGRTATALPPERRRISVVPQEGALFPHLSVEENVAYGLDRPARRSGRAADVLEMVGLAGFADRMPHQLSGGQQQRVAVARALAPRPPVVLLDEPFSALDAALRVDLRRDVRDALRADGATAVLVTHDQGEALSMADELAVLRDGRIVQSGRPDAVYGEPADAWVAGFVGEAVWLPAVVAAGVASTPLGPVSVAGTHGDGTARVLLRPEQLRVVRTGEPESVGGTVVRRAFHGHDALLTLELADGIEVLARVFDPATAALAPGERVGLRVHGPARAYPGDAAI